MTGVPRCEQVWQWFRSSCVSVWMQQIPSLFCSLLFFITKTLKVTSFPNKDWLLALLLLDDYAFLLCKHYVFFLSSGIFWVALKRLSVGNCTLNFHNIQQRCRTYFPHIVPPWLALSCCSSRMLPVLTSRCYSRVFLSVRWWVRWVEKPCLTSTAPQEVSSPRCTTLARNDPERTEVRRRGEGAGGKT